VRCSASSFNFHDPLVSSSCSSLLPCLPVTYITFSTLPSTICFNRHFLRKVWPIQSASLLLLYVCMFFLSYLTHVILSNFSNGRSNCLSLSFSCITFKNSPHISDLRFLVSKFQHRTIRYSNSSTSLVSSLNLSTICW
jgi:hypothetical protein